MTIHVAEIRHAQTTYTSLVYRESAVQMTDPHAIHVSAVDTLLPDVPARSSPDLDASGVRRMDMT